jgi:hypothetical protein
MFLREMWSSRAIVAECSGKVFGIGGGAEKNGRGKKTREPIAPPLEKVKRRGGAGRALR